ncbi:FAD dependent oxidoreductase superfamily protein [Colletotrichum asianum]|uniref:FAD dependent oxidoreductase superfamily protein n=1 Tax=Colletotrichum asianum TaxID=702518 RepID=A0A8H3WI25_9PEZI|nr:FAD dependent oxidoreductase superfamily protein [Colletotrichum asianum]
MADTRTRKAKDRLLAVAKGLQPPDSMPKDFIERLTACLVADPLLPRPNQSISLWQEPPHPTLATVQSPNLPSYVDFVVIGSGITGCSVTKGLLENEVLGSGDNPSQVVVLEARNLCSGATGRNGGQLVSPVAHTFAGLVERFGKATAIEMARFSLMNIERVMDMVRHMGPEIRTESEIRDLIKVMVPETEFAWLESLSSLEEFREAFPKHRYLHKVFEQKELVKEWNVKVGFGTIVHKAGAIWPYRLITGIFESLLGQYPNRLSIETNTPVTVISQSSSSQEETANTTYKYKITTPRGTVHAKQVIHCTNANASHLLKPLRGKMYPYRGTMSVQKAGKHLEHVGSSASWSLLNKPTLDHNTGLYDGGLYYLQQNGLTGDIWVGGGSSSIFGTLSSDDTSVPGQAMKDLARFLPNYFFKGWAQGEEPEIRGMWTGLQCDTSDGLPLIGKIPGSASGRESSDAEWICGGYNGYGMDKAWLSGEALVKMIAGEGVPEWLPKVFLLTETRFEQALTLEKALDRWISLARESN